jgi:hypothetical protein
MAWEVYKYIIKVYIYKRIKFNVAVIIRLELARVSGDVGCIFQ